MTYEGNELRQLRGDGLDRSVPPWQDDRWWIRLPARMIHGCPIILRKMHADMGIGWIFLAFLPFALRSRLAGWESKRVFAMNLLTLPGLEALLNFSTELMGLSSRKLFTDVLNQILPNVFPLIIGTVAIAKNEVGVAQSFFIGDVITNILLGIGAPFIAAGIFSIGSNFNADRAKIMSAFTLLISSPFAISFVVSTTLRDTDSDTQHTLFKLSIVVAFVTGFTYALWLIFKFWTHSGLFNFDEEPTEEPSASVEESAEPRSTALRIFFAMLVMVVVALTVFCVRWLMDSVPSFTINNSMPPTFISCILLPLMINLSNFIQACRISRRSQMNLVINLTLGASVEIILLTLPILIFFGWITGHHFLLNFGTLETIVLFMSVFMVSNIARIGRSSYMLGLTCVALYLTTALAFYFHQDPT